MTQTPSPSKLGCGPGCGLLALLGVAAIGIILALGGGNWLLSFGGANPGGPGGGSTPSPTPTAHATPIATPSPTPLPGTIIPTISARSYTAGSAPLNVTGSFNFSSTLALLPQDAFSDGVETTLNYGFHLDPGGMLLVFSERTGADGLGLNVSYGPFIATYTGEGCSWEVEVTDANLSGHISCTGIPVTHEPDGTDAGVVDIELDFSADS